MRGALLMLSISLWALTACATGPRTAADAHAQDHQSEASAGDNAAPSPRCDASGDAEASQVSATASFNPVRCCRLESSTSGQFWCCRWFRLRACPAGCQYQQARRGDFPNRPPPRCNCPP
jgi:hypothetical protein